MANKAINRTVEALNADLLKLDDIQANATANSTDEILLNRENHTGTQEIATVTGLQDELNSKVEKVIGKGLSESNYTSLEKAKLSLIQDEATKNATDSELRDRNTHTGTQDISTISSLQSELGNRYLKDETYSNDEVDNLLTSKASSTDVYTKSESDTLLNDKVDKVTGKQLSTEDYTTIEKSKLSGIQAGATVNSTDTELRDRSTHTGEQAISTITGLQSELEKVSKIATDGDGKSFLSNDGTYKIVEGTKQFLGLEDTPVSYEGEGGKILAVKPDETGVEFVPNDEESLEPWQIDTLNQLKPINDNGYVYFSNEDITSPESVEERVPFRIDGRRRVYQSFILAIPYGSGAYGEGPYDVLGVGSWVDVGKILTYEEMQAYQEKLVSGDNIKTINGSNVLGSGNIDIDFKYPTMTDFTMDFEPKKAENERIDMTLTTTNPELFDKAIVTIDYVDGRVTAEVLRDITGYYILSPMDFAQLSTREYTINIEYRDIRMIKYDSDLELKFNI